MKRQVETFALVLLVVVDVSEVRLGVELARRLLGATLRQLPTDFVIRQLSVGLYLYRD
jgi:hypothetical protein